MDDRSGARRAASCRRYAAALKLLRSIPQAAPADPTLHSQRRERRSIVVASIKPGEGEIITALDLLWLRAPKDGVKCPIIDSDLRLPSSADYPGIETGTSLSDIFAGRAALQDSIVKIEPAGLPRLQKIGAEGKTLQTISGGENWRGRRSGTSASICRASLSGTRQKAGRPAHGPS